MARVLGLGGLFFKSDDPDGTREWYGRVLGIAFEEWGGTVFLPETAAAHPGAGVPMAALSGQHAAEAIMRDRISALTSAPTVMPGGTSTGSARTGRAPFR